MDTSINECVPPDMLHLRLRVGEKLTTNCIHASADHTKNKLVPGFVELVRSTGVPFKVSETMIHGRNQTVFNSLTGRHWRIMLPKLPQLIRNSQDIFAEAHKEPLAMLLEGFVHILSFAGKCSKTDAEALAAETNNWMTAFLDLGKQGLRGFSSRDVTPYLHWMHIHIPFSVSRFGGLDKLSGELLEAQNDEIKKTHLRRTHCKDARLTLRMEKRREFQAMEEELEAMNRPKRRRKEGPIHPW